MRVMLAIAILVAGTLAPSPSVDAARKYTRAKSPCYVRQPRRAWTPPCRAWRYRPAWQFDPNDPTGEFRGFPGWARKAFSEPRN